MWWHHRAGGGASAQQFLVPGVPAMRRLGILFVIVAACGGGGGPAPPPADRPLDGTRFADVPPAPLAAVLAGLCVGTAPLVDDVARSVAAMEAPAGAPGDDATLTEVLVAGVAEVCPERVAADLSAAYPAPVRFAAGRGAGGAGG